MTSETINIATLLDLKLHGIREVLHNRLSQARSQGLGYDEFLSMLLQDEAEDRRNTRIRRLLKVAAFRQPVSLEDLDFTASRGLDKKVLNDIGGGRFILDGVNILILGPTGVGKSYLASAIGNAACRSGHTTLFFRMNALIEQMLLARAKGTYLNLLRRLSACDLLVLDDFGIKPLNPQQAQDLYDVLDERGEDKSTIVTSQVPVENWNEVIADPINCEAVTDRLAARAIRLHMKGESYRKRRKGKQS